MNHETINRNRYGAGNRQVRRVPDGDFLNPCKTITAGQMAARMGVQESQVQKAIRQLGIEAVAVHSSPFASSEYALRDFGVVRAHMRGKR